MSMPQREIRRLGGEGILNEGDLPGLTSSKDRVREFMRDGCWHPAQQIIAASRTREGLRRMRDLRKEGWDVERRRIKGSHDFEYRIKKQVPNLSQASLSF